MRNAVYNGSPSVTKVKKFNKIAVDDVRNMLTVSRKLYWCDVSRRHNKEAPDFLIR